MGICFSSSAMSESPTHSRRVQWDCCLISVQLPSQIGKSLADKGTHQNKWLTKGRALFPFFWNAAYCILSISLCVVPNQSKSCQQKWQRLTDFYPIINQKLALTSQKQAVPQDWLSNIPCCFCKPSVPQWLSQWTVTLVSGLQQRPKCFFLFQKVTPSSPKALQKLSPKNTSTLIILLE